MSEYAKHRYDVKYTARFIILPSSQQLGRAACFCQAHSGACQAAGFLWSHCITSTYFGTVRNSMQSRQLSPTRSKTHSLLLCLGTPSQNRPRHPTTCQSHSSLELSNMLCINQGLLYAVEHAKLWGVTMSTPLTIQVGGQVVQVWVAHCHGLQMGRNGIHRFLLWKCNSSKVLRQGTGLYTGSSKKKRKPKSPKEIAMHITVGHCLNCNWYFNNT